MVEEPDSLESMELQRGRHDDITYNYNFSITD